MILVKEVISAKEIKEFIQFPIKLYKGNDYYVPCLYMDEKAMFKKSFTYSNQCKHKCFIAYKDGVVVGRIQAIIQEAANKKWNQNRIRFTRFDSINDKEVSRALFDKAVEYAKENGITEIVGPLGFSDFEREGLLIEGFDQYQTFEENYNFDYYQDLIEDYGFKKEVDWVEYRLGYKPDFSEQIHKLSEVSIKHYGLHREYPLKGESKKHFIERLSEEFFNIVDEGYDKIYGTVPFTEEMKKAVKQEFALLLDPKYIIILRDKQEKVVAMGLGFPTMTETFLHTNGRITIKRIVSLMKSVKHPKRVDLGLVAVDPKFLKTGVIAPIIEFMFDFFENEEVEYMDTNLNLEDNLDVRNLWKYFDANQNKRRRSYVKKI